MADPDWFNAAVAFGSAITGAVVGAIPAFMLARRSAREVLERDRAGRRDAERAVGMRAHVKLGTIVNSILTLRRQMSSAIDNPPAPDVELWQRVEPVVGFAGEERIIFDAEEAALFLAAGANEFAEALLLIARRHAVHAEVLREYARGRDALRLAMPAPAAVDGERASTYLSRDEMMRVRPMMIGLNSLLGQLLAHLAEDVDLALALARDFGPILKGYFDDPKYPGFAVPDDEASALAVRRYSGLTREGPTPESA